MSLETEQIIALIRALQELALESQRKQLRKTIQDLAGQVAAVQIAPVQKETLPIKVFKPVDVTGSVRCYETWMLLNVFQIFWGQKRQMPLTICSENMKIVSDTIRP